MAINVTGLRPGVYGEATYERAQPTIPSTNMFPMIIGTGDDSYGIQYYEMIRYGITYKFEYDITDQVDGATSEFTLPSNYRPIVSPTTNELASVDDIDVTFKGTPQVVVDIDPSNGTFELQSPPPNDLDKELKISFYFDDRDIEVVDEDLSDQADNTNVTFYVKNLYITDGSNYGIITNDPSDVIVKKNGVIQENWVSTLDGGNGKIVLNSAPLSTDTIEVSYTYAYPRNWDELPEDNVLDIERVLRTPSLDGESYIEGLEWIADGNKIIFGPTALLEGGLTSTGDDMDSDVVANLILVSENVSEVYHDIDVNIGAGTSLYVQEEIVDSSSVSKSKPARDDSSIIGFTHADSVTYADVVTDIATKGVDVAYVEGENKKIAIKADSSTGGSLVRIEYPTERLDSSSTFVVKKESGASEWKLYKEDGTTAIPFISGITNDFGATTADLFDLSSGVPFRTSPSAVAGAYEFTFRNVVDIASIQGDGGIPTNTVTVVTSVPHNLETGTGQDLTIANCSTIAYNETLTAGSATDITVIDNVTFTYTTSGHSTSTEATDGDISESGSEVYYLQASFTPSGGTAEEISNPLHGYNKWYTSESFIDPFRNVLVNWALSSDADTAWGSATDADTLTVTVSDTARDTSVSTALEMPGNIYCYDIPGVKFTMVNANLTSVGTGNTALIKTYNFEESLVDPGTSYYVDYTISKQDYNELILLTSEEYNSGLLELLIGDYTPDNTAVIGATACFEAGDDWVGIQQLRRSGNDNQPNLNDWNDAITKLKDGFEDKITPYHLVPMTVDDDILSSYQQAVNYLSTPRIGRYCVLERGFSQDYSYQEVANKVKLIKSTRVIPQYPNDPIIPFVNSNGVEREYLMPGYVTAAVYAGMRASSVRSNSDSLLEAGVTVPLIRRFQSTVQDRKLGIVDLAGCTTWTNDFGVPKVWNESTSDNASKLRKEPAVQFAVDEFLITALQALKDGGLIGVKQRANQNDIESVINGVITSKVNQELIAEGVVDNIVVDETDVEISRATVSIRPYNFRKWITLQINIRSGV